MSLITLVGVITIALSTYMILGSDSLHGLPVQYGDSEDPEFTASLPLSSATVVVSTLPSLESNAAIRHGLETAGFQGHFIATAHDEGEVAKLEFIGAQRTLLPFLDAAERAPELIIEDLLVLQRAQPAKAAP